jgi:hypothetical protein
LRTGFCCGIKPAAHQLNQQNLPVCVQPQLRFSGKLFDPSKIHGVDLIFSTRLHKQGITLIVSYVIKSETPLRLKDLILSKKKKKQQKKEEGAVEFSSESLDSPLRREFLLSNRMLSPRLLVYSLEKGCSCLLVNYFIFHAAYQLLNHSRQRRCANAIQLSKTFLLWLINLQNEPSALSVSEKW